MYECCSLFVSSNVAFFLLYCHWVSDIQRTAKQMKHDEKKNVYTTNSVRIQMIYDNGTFSTSYEKEKNKRLAFIKKDYLCVQWICVVGTPDNVKTVQQRNCIKSLFTELLLLWIKRLKTNNHSIDICYRSRKLEFYYTRYYTWSYRCVLSMHVFSLLEGIHFSDLHHFDLQIIRRKINT